MQWSFDFERFAPDGDIDQQVWSSSEVPSQLPEGSALRSVYVPPEDSWPASISVAVLNMLLMDLARNGEVLILLEYCEGEEALYLGHMEERGFRVFASWLGDLHLWRHSLAPLFETSSVCDLPAPLSPLLGSEVEEFEELKRRCQLVQDSSTRTEMLVAFNEAASAAMQARVESLRSWFRGDLMKTQRLRADDWPSSGRSCPWSEALDATLSECRDASLDALERLMEMADEQDLLDELESLGDSEAPSLEGWSWGSSGIYFGQIVPGAQPSSMLWADLGPELQIEVVGLLDQEGLYPSSHLAALLISRHNGSRPEARAALSITGIGAELEAMGQPSNGFSIELPDSA
jgi:hypothetical protein